MAEKISTSRLNGRLGCERKAFRLGDEQVRKFCAGSFAVNLSLLRYEGIGERYRPDFVCPRRGPRAYGPKKLPV